MIISELIYNLSLLIALSTFSSFIDKRFNRKELSGKILQGLLFGITVMIGMSYPFIFTEGVIFDGRSIILSLCALFFGPISGLIAAFLAIVYRIIISGSGMVPGILVIVSSFLIGFIFYKKYHSSNQNNISSLQLYIFGLLVHLAMLIILLILPTNIIKEIYNSIAISIIGLYPLVTVIIGKILSIQEQNEKYLIQLKENEERWQYAIEGTDDGVWDWNINANTIYFSPKLKNMIGFDDDQMNNTIDEWQTKVHPDDLPKVLKEIIKHLQKKTDFYSSEYRLKCKDNSYKWILDKGKVSVYNDDGTAARMLGTHKDISIRKQNEELLKKSEAQFRTLVNSLDDIVYTLDTEQKHTGAYGYWIKKSGLNKEYFIGKTAREIFGSENAEIHEQANSKALNGQANVYYWSTNTNGSTVYYQTSVSPIRDDENNIIGIVGIGRDISDLKRSEEAVRISNERFKQVSESTHEWIWELDKNGLFTYSNSVVKDVLGYSVEEVVGKKHFHDFLTDPIKASIKSKLDNMFLNKQIIYKLETVNLHKNGSKVILETSGFPIENSNGELLGYRGINSDITERKRAEEIIIKSNERMKLLVEETPHIFFYEQNLNGSMQYVSPSVKLISGYTTDQWIQSKDLFLTDSPTNIIAKQKSTETLRGIISNKSFLVEIFHSNGSRILLEVNERPIIKNKKIVGLQGVAYDVTKRRTALEALKESEEKYRNLVEVFPDAIIIDQNNLISYVNPAAIKLFQVSSTKELVGKRTIDIFYPIYRERISKSIDAILSEGISLPIQEKKIIKDNGETVEVELSATPFTLIGQKAIHFVLRDITQRKKVEATLRQSEDRFRNIFNENLVVMLMLEIDTRKIVDANSAALDFYGYSRRKLLSMRIDDINTLSSDVLEDRMKKAKQLKQIHFEFKHRLANGKIKDVDVVSSKIISSGKEYVISIIIDITKRKSIEKELEIHRNNLKELVELQTSELNLINKQLLKEIKRKEEVESLLQDALEKEKELNILKSRFISTTSHEFRTPLTTILSSAELIQRYGKKWDDQKYSDHIERIKTSVDYLTNLMDDVLLVSRADSGKITFHPVETDLFSFTNKIIEEAKLQSTKKHRLVLKFKSEQKNFIVDPKHIQIIIQNLLTNAIKYSPKGGKIELEITSIQNELMITVEDEGLGVSNEDKQHLFEPFFRSINTEAIQGTGLGLTIVKNAVELHEGNISVESSLGEGTRFIIKMPVR